MYKYKYFLLFFCGIAILLLWYKFPVIYDNNDDQVMFALSSGLFSGALSPNLILTHIVIGKILNHLFIICNKINWYTLYLQIAQLISFLIICYLFLKKNNITFILSFLVVMFILSGFFTQCIVKLQFTTVSIFCTAASLFCLESEIKRLHKFILVLSLFTISILIRKDVFYIFILFSIPVFVKMRMEKKTIRFFIAILMSTFLIFSCSVFFNNQNEAYKKQQTYSMVNALDIIAAKPAKIKEDILLKNNYTVDDLILLQSWFVADDTYLKGKYTEQFSASLKTNRSVSELKSEFNKFVMDERYVLLMYVLSFLIILLFDVNSLKLTGLNLLLFCILFIYLIITSRIPHRLTFPVLTYLILLNLFLFMRSDNQNHTKLLVLIFLLIPCGYKLYCISKSCNIQKRYHQNYIQLKNEINTHPDNLFIALDGFPIQYMNAWLTPENNFTANNLLLSGWYACTSDYQILLKKHQLNNLTSDLRFIKNILFLTDSQELQKAYINVMQQRYNIKCHFEEMKNNFTYLHPKKLVIDN